METDTNPVRQTMQFKIRHLYSAIATTNQVALLHAPPDGAWSSSDGAPSWTLLVTRAPAHQPSALSSKPSVLPHEQR